MYRRESPVKIQVNKKTINLTQKNYLAEGGEGKVYVRGQTAFKIYEDPKKMIPLGKIQELSVLDRPNIIKPTDVVHKKTLPVGYSMNYIKDTYALCQLFPQTFWTRNHFDIKSALKLIEKLNDDLNHIHSKGILVVDLNEMNILISKDFKNPYWIDVDSWQTKSFPATALMETVRDRHASGFNEGTDWFAFAVITFQLLTGIHPYKGRHKVKGLDQRMAQNISVFNKDVTIPKVCRPIQQIPKNLHDWYFDVFEKGLRSAAPIKLNQAIVIQLKSQRISGSNRIDIQLVNEYGSPVLGFYNYFQDNCAITKDGFYANHHRRPLGQIRTKRPQAIYLNNEPYLVWEKDGLNFFNTVTKKSKYYEIETKDFMIYDQRVYAHCDENIIEYSHTGPLITSNIVANTMANATKVFDGVIIQDLLGMKVAALFPEKGRCEQIKLPELKGYKIIEARFRKIVLQITASKKGRYYRFVYRFDRDWAYDLRQVKDVILTGLNFVVLDNGVTVQINENDEIEIFGPKGQSEIKKISDSKISGKMILYSSGVKVFFALDDKLYRIQLK